MSEIKITYESLYNILRQEKNSEELQELPQDFFKNVSEYMDTKKEILLSQESKNSIFTQPEAQKTRKQIEQIQKIIKELYERREHKIMMLALFSSRTGADTKNPNLLDEELNIYLDLRNILTKSRLDLFNRLTNNVSKVELKIEPKVLKIEENEKALKLIKIVHHIPKFIGDDLQIYGPFEPGDLVSISSKVADLLINKKKAELMKYENPKEN